MTLTGTQKALHRRTYAGSTATRIGQFTGALLALGGVAALVPRHLTGAWAGLTGLVMASTFRAHPPGRLAIAARATGPGGRGSGGGGGTWAAGHQVSPRDIPGHPWVRRRQGR